MTVAQNSWTKVDIEGQEVLFTHGTTRAGDVHVHVMGTLELDGAWHNVVAEIETDAFEPVKIKVATIDGTYVSDFANEGAKAFVAWAAETYYADVREPMPQLLAA